MVRLLRPIWPAASTPPQSKAAFKAMPFGARFRWAARGASVGVAAATMSVAEYAYYPHHVRGSQSWNLFEGYGKRR
ncbi:Uncharacterised protein [Mycobacteroides abscessus]|uniref:hypothetical protein n=1 Tax=Mycobacteroides abscessus TaxID=36809 RepID=UPI0005E4F69D|nr:hypothetical protein [Mycobacteroides abscessus]CPS37818.1 Uncharacterised protein [Mycobacteroides abscessus]CPS42600.1 Uncharacterised protein [Mycobacteroides abscessus]CPT33129.1 Uncharacterised protein [Mycobacteroides abscessus]CPT58922.1 Uncharacterised protein [Mycobacteroides abscessus]CPT68552.1 Uncharacterised protein [Mycobacteroides abscessus]